MTLAAWNDLNYETKLLNDISLVCCLHCCWCLYGLSLKRHARGTLAKHRFKVAFWFVELYRITFSLTTEECCKCNERIWVIIMTICSWFVLFFSGSFQTFICWQLRLGAPVLTGSALDKSKFLMPALSFTSAFRLTYNVPFPWPVHLQIRLLLFGLLELGLLPNSVLKTRILKKVVIAGLLLSCYTKITGNQSIVFLMCSYMWNFKMKVHSAVSST